MFIIVDFIKTKVPRLIVLSLSFSYFCFRIITLTLAKYAVDDKTRTERVWAGETTTTTISETSVCDNDQNTFSDKIQLFVVKTKTMFVE